MDGERQSQTKGRAGERQSILAEHLYSSQDFHHMAACHHKIDTARERNSLRVGRGRAKVWSHVWCEEDPEDSVTGDSAVRGGVSRPEHLTHPSVLHCAFLSVKNSLSHKVEVMRSMRVMAFDVSHQNVSVMSPFVWTWLLCIDFF